VTPLGDDDGDRGFRPLADINVTPLVDVMLVLLIIFMVTAPLLAAGLKVDLPKAQAAPSMEPGKPVIVTVRKDGKILVGQDETTRPRLAETVRAQLGGDTSKSIYLQGDRDSAYTHVIGVIDALAQGGMTKVVLVVDRKASSGEGGDGNDRP
jgi:biopolymer transport protein TolR